MNEDEYEVEEVTIAWGQDTRKLICGDRNERHEWRCTLKPGHPGPHEVTATVTWGDPNADW